MRYIFIHGLGQDASSWNKTVACLGEQFPASCPDLFRLLGNKEPFYTNLYRAFSEYCETSTEPVCLCGLSLGAILALHYALDQPGKVHSLVLIGAQYKMPKFMLGVQNAIFHLMPKASFQKLGLSKSGVIQLSKSLTTVDFSRRLTDVRCSSLILCGEKDKANMKAAQGLAGHISGAELRKIAGAGHEANRDAPEKLAAAISEFWGQNQR